MRSCLIQVLVALLVVLLLLWFALPLAVSALAAGALNAAGFNGTDTRVEVSANPPPLLLTGRGNVHIVSSDVSLSDLHAAAVDVTLTDVDLLSREIGGVEGTLEGVQVAAPNGDTVSIDDVSLAGPAGRTVASCDVSLAEARELAESQLASQGVKATVLLAAPNVVTLNVGGNAFKGRLVATDGSLFLVPESKAMPTVLLISPGRGSPFRVESVSISETHVILSGTIDVESLLS